MAVSTSLQLVGAREMQAMLAGLPKDIQRELRPRIRTITELVAVQARANASAYPTKSGGPSKRIPGAIGTRVSFGARTAGGAVVVNSAKAPHARPLEGLSSRGGTFRHPVFGTDKWVSQATRPFLFESIIQTEREAVALIEQAVIAALPR
jgi:hypothetical protein